MAETAVDEGRLRRSYDLISRCIPIRRVNLKTGEMGPERYAVPNGNGKVYIVDLEEPSCTCADFRWRGGRCKHILAAEAKRQIGEVPRGGEAEEKVVN